MAYAFTLSVQPHPIPTCLGVILITDSRVFQDLLLKYATGTVKMREHSYLGYNILRKIPFLAEAAEIVYAHQERYDGTGYPRGLKGDEIPLGARIVSIADTLDAITSDRPYRPARSFEAARKEIEEWSGRQFDPEIVDVFLEMPDKIWEDFRKDVDAQIMRS
jgi:cyclic di-GMP phosphodiesterase